MVGARAPATRPRPGRFAQRSAPRKSPQRPALERVPAHDGSGRRSVEDKRTLNSHRYTRHFSFWLNRVSLARSSSLAFGTHALPMFARCYPHSFTFYVANPIAQFYFLISSSCLDTTPISSLLLALRSELI